MGGRAIIPEVRASGKREPKAVTLIPNQRAARSKETPLDQRKRPPDAIFMSALHSPCQHPVNRPENSGPQKTGLRDAGALNKQGRFPRATGCPGDPGPFDTPNLAARRPKASKVENGLRGRGFGRLSPAHTGASREVIFLGVWHGVQLPYCRFSGGLGGK